MRLKMKSALIAFIPLTGKTIEVIYYPRVMALEYAFAAFLVPIYLPYNKMILEIICIGDSILLPWCELK